MKKFTIAIILSVMASAFVVVPAVTSAEQAQSKKQAANSVKFRQSLFQLIRSNIGPLGAMAKNRMPYDTDVMMTNAIRLEQLALMLPDYFEIDTSSFDVATEALPVIWTDKDDFLAKTNDLASAAKALQVVAQSADASQYRQAIGKVGATCKGCHDNYKKD